MSVSGHSCVCVCVLAVWSQFAPCLMPRLDKRAFIPPYFVTFLSYVPLQPRQHWANSWLLTDLQLLSPPTYCLGWVSKSEDKSTFYPRYVWVNSPWWRCKCGCEVHPEGWAAVPPRKSFLSPQSETWVAKQEARQQIFPPSFNVG